MSPYYSKRDTYHGNPYAEAKALDRTVFGAKEPYWFFRDEGLQVENGTRDPYAVAKELLRQRVAS